MGVEVREVGVREVVQEVGEVEKAGVQEAVEREGAEVVAHMRLAGKGMTQTDSGSAEEHKSPAELLPNNTLYTFRRTDSSLEEPKNALRCASAPLTEVHSRSIPA